MRTRPGGGGSGRRIGSIPAGLPLPDADRAHPDDLYTSSMRIKAIPNDPYTSSMRAKAIPNDPYTSSMRAKAIPNDPYTSSMRAMGALSPWRGPSFTIRV